MSRRGKKVFDIDWDHEGASIKVPVKVHTVEPCYGNPKKIMEFRAKHNDSDLNISETDVEKLREKVIAHLNKWYSIQWTIWLLVSFRAQDRSTSRIELNYELEYQAIGEGPDGQEMSMRLPDESVDKDGKWNGQRYCGDPKVGRPWTGKEKLDKWDRRDRSPEARALVKATTGNIAALFGFGERLGQLGTEIRDFFSNKGEVEKLLSDMASRLLPEPTPGKKSTRKPRRR